MISAAAMLMTTSPIQRRRSAVASAVIVP